MKISSLLSVLVLSGFACFSSFAQQKKMSGIPIPEDSIRKTIPGAGKTGAPADTSKKAKPASPAATPARPGTTPATPAKPGAGVKPGTQPGKPGAAKPEPRKDTAWMREAIKRHYNDCYVKRLAGACDSAVYWGNQYFAAIKGEDANAGYLRCLAAFHRLNNQLNEDMQKSQGKSKSNIKNTDAMIAALPKEKKDEYLVIAQTAKTELTWFTEAYNTEEKSMFRLADVKQKLFIVEEYIKKLSK